MPEKLPPLPARPPDAHKASVGRVLVIAGSTGMTGAGALASRAALRSGAGLVTWAIPEPLIAVAEILCTEVICHPLPSTKEGAANLRSREFLFEASRRADAALLGPGMPAEGETGELMRRLIPEIPAPLVLDAGALTALGTDLAPVAKRSWPAVLTPHPGEMARLTGRGVEEIRADREAAAQALARACGAVILLKGRRTVVTDGKRTAVNQTGNPGMATAGSGDVLAGLLAALLAQKMPAFDAAVLAAHLHGLAGDIAAQAKGIHGLIAGDIAEALPQAFLRYGSDRVSER
ncbi:MAG: NAD(P)H-hydrate dehydratase [Planctomycetota bacterium]